MANSTKLLRTLIIDDEPDARSVLKLYCAQSEFINIVGEAASVQEGVAAIKICKPDLVFLDIHMTDGSGFDLLDALDNPSFHLVFTTAHDEFALKAFQYSAFQYLLKPIDSEEFTKTLERLERLSPTSSEQVARGVQFFNSGSSDRIILNTGKTQIAVQLAEIVTIHAEANFSKVNLLSGEVHLVNTSLKDFEKLLPEALFYRCHHSHIVQLGKIRTIENKDGGLLVHTVIGEELPVSRRKRKELLERFGRA